MLLRRLSEHQYSRYEDEDFYDDLRERKRRVKYNPHVGAIALGTVGAVGGHALGKAPGAMVGTAGLGYLGYRLGKNSKEATEREVHRLRKRYEFAKPSERRYLRERERYLERKRLAERQARAQEQIAWNTLLN